MLKILSGLIIVCCAVIYFPELKHVITIKELNTRVLLAANHYLSQCSHEATLPSIELETRESFFKFKENPNYWFAVIPGSADKISGDITETYISVHELKGCSGPYIMKLQSRDIQFKYTEETAPKSLGYIQHPNRLNSGSPLIMPFFIYLENTARLIVYLSLLITSLFLWKYLFKKSEHLT